MATTTNRQQHLAAYWLSALELFSAFVNITEYGGGQNIDWLGAESRFRLAEKRSLGEPGQFTWPLREEDQVEIEDDVISDRIYSTHGDQE